MDLAFSFLCEEVATTIRADERRHEPGVSARCDGLLANDRLPRHSSAPLERLATDPIPACATTHRDAEMFDL